MLLTVHCLFCSASPPLDLFMAISPNYLHFRSILMLIYYISNIQTRIVVQHKFKRRPSFIFDCTSEQKVFSTYAPVQKFEKTVFHFFFFQ